MIQFDNDSVLNERNLLSYARDALLKVAPSYSANIVIGFHAPRGAGKDTTAGNLAKHILPFRSSLNAFADPLYEAASVITGLPVVYLRDQANKNRPITPQDTPITSLHGKIPRVILEKLGTELVRDQIHHDHWVELMRAEILKAAPGTWTLITDVRFCNEVALCDLVVELRRDGDVGYGGEDEHVSRRRLPSDFIDATFQLTPNDFSVAGLCHFTQWLAGALEGALTHKLKQNRQDMLDFYLSPARLVEAESTERHNQFVAQAAGRSRRVGSEVINASLDPEPEQSSTPK